MTSGCSLGSSAARPRASHSNIVIPKSVTPTRVHENLDVFDSELTSKDIDTITTLDRDMRTGPDPDTLN
ncbi:hypothetical protein [Actinoallomurus acaciae]|uniref:hypothetical protein n=1 Tax=Actinoallomurus acaciae TaxID=502577 RepID=UPI003671ADD9